jgi:hypothetical protein
MFAPKLYKVIKLSITYIIANNYNVTLNKAEFDKFSVNQQDNMLFRQIRLITHRSESYNPFVVFVDASGWKTRQKEIRHLIHDGMHVNGNKFIISERSASMTRNSILSFIDFGVYPELERRISMDLKMDKTVLSKYMAYRGLMFSSCHNLDNYMPKIIVVKDFEHIIKDQQIKYLTDELIHFVDKHGNKREWRQKGVNTTTRDITVNAFDGCGIHHPNITKDVMELLCSDESPTSILWRAPFIKGVTHEMDYVSFFKERGVDYIQDYWGRWHDVNASMIIIGESMYKGLKYFKNSGTSSDWDDYWNKFEKYNHCLGVAKWNFDRETEPVMTRANYQIKSENYYNHIINGDEAFVYTFLGLRADKQKDMNQYMHAILKNPIMMHEDGIRNYLINMLRKKIDEMKCGKLYLDACFRFLAPDLIAFMEHVGGLAVNGILSSNEFYTNSGYKEYNGEYLIERNPHLSHSEHVILMARNDDDVQRWFGHLSNVCITNIKGLTVQRLNGADFDGDLVLVIDEPIILRGIERGIPITMDIEDKITALAETYNIDNIANLIMRSFDNRIGDYSNYATCYHNIQTKTEEQHKKYSDYISILSVATGKEIDKAKTGVSFILPRHIVTYAGKLPYFMKYASPYYKTLKIFNNNQSNMNRLCYEVEKWGKDLHIVSSGKFDPSIMIDTDVTYSDDEFAAIEKIYCEFIKDIGEMKRDQYKFANYDKYRSWIWENYQFTRYEATNFMFDWAYYYELYKVRCAEVVPDVKKLANIVTNICYYKYPKRGKNFIWVVAGDGVVQNIKQTRITLPLRDNNGNITILGKNYRMIDFLYLE